MATKGLNKVQIIGRLGNDPETKVLENGATLTTISIATSEQWTDKNTGELREVTEWHRVTAFGKLAEIMGAYLVKGSQVYIEGKLKTRKWQDQNGQDRYTTDIVAETMQMLDRKPADQVQGGESKVDHKPDAVNNVVNNTANTQVSSDKPAMDNVQDTQVNKDDIQDTEIPF